MSTLAADLVAELGLEPGQSYTETIGDCEVVVRNPVKSVKQTEPEEEPSQFADMVMLNVILNYPPNPNSITVIPTPGEWPPMDPVVIDEWDRTPE